MTSETKPLVVETREGLARALAVAPNPRAVVMTMGGLHAAHGGLMTIARDLVGAEGHVTTTIFVNPLQFAATEDLGKYPRTFDADVAMCAQRSVDLVFAPTPDVMYPNGDAAVTVDPGSLGQLYEGVARPTHFRGVLTVVAKFLQLLQPDFAVFGEKDYQQLTLIRQMVADLDIPTQIVGGPIGREESGLAMSTRNKYLSPVAREVAARIPVAIAAGQAGAAGGTQACIDATLEVLHAPAAVSVEVEYVAVTDPLMRPAPESGEARLILTGIVDGTRLLDNAPVQLGPSAESGARSSTGDDGTE